MWHWRSLALALLLAGACLTATTIAPPASAAPADETAAVPGPVVVVGVPDLRWQDLDPAVTPTLWQMMGRSSVAAMTDRSGERFARRAAGWLTLNTGTRARANVEAGTVPDPGVAEQLQALRAANRSARYDAQVGALGDALHRAGLTVAAVGGPGAVLGGMAADGTVDSRAPTVAEALPGADVVIVELPQLYPVDRRDPGALRDALTEIDNLIGTVVQALPGNASLLVAGVSEGFATPTHLHVAMATGPPFGTGRLTSASTGRAGVVQLIDVAPTVLWLLGAAVPSGMLGAPWRTMAGSGAATAQQVSAFVDLDRRSRAEIAVSHWYDAAVAWAAFLYVAAVVIAWTRRRSRLPAALGAVIASIPAASFLVQLVPWWRGGTWLLAPLTIGVATAVGSVAAFSPWTRRGPWRTAAFVGAVTAAVIVVDASTGSPLSLDAPFGDNPIIAGRFHGIGNVAFALLGAGTLVLAAAVATRLPDRRAAAAVFGLGAVAIAVDGLPALGDDFGGVVALLPAVAVLGLVILRVRLSWRRLIAVFVVTVMTTAGISLYDYLRPPAQRTHLGRFIGQIADGSAWTVVHRKLDSSLGSFTDGWSRWIVVGWVVLAVVAWVGHRRGRLHLPAAVDHRIAGGLLASLTVLAILGAGFNDSGLGVTAFTFYVAAPLLVSMAEPLPEAPISSVPRARAVVPPGFGRS
jgi:hypothetical protein